MKCGKALLLLSLKGINLHTVCGNRCGKNPGSVEITNCFFVFHVSTDLVFILLGGNVENCNLMVESKGFVRH